MLVRLLKQKLGTLENTSPSCLSTDWKIPFLGRYFSFQSILLDTKMPVSTPKSAYVQFFPFYFIKNSKISKSGIQKKIRKFRIESKESRNSKIIRISILKWNLKLIICDRYEFYHEYDFYSIEWSHHRFTTNSGKSAE